MKAIAHLEISDADRDVLANLIDGKESKRMVTRKEVVEIAEAALAAMIDLAKSSGEVIEKPTRAEVPQAQRPAVRDYPQHIVDHYLQLIEEGKMASWAQSYIRGRYNRPDFKSARVS